MWKFWCMLVLLAVLLPMPVVAAGTDAIKQGLQQLETEAVDRAASEMGAEIRFSELLQKATSGEFDLTFSGWQEKISEMTLGEFRLQGKLLMQLVIVVLLSSILKQLSDSFQGKSVGEMGFYLCYMVLIVVILNTFHGISDMVVERMRGICGVYSAMIPVFLVLLGAKGELAKGALIGPTVMGGSAALSMAISRIIVPAILLAVSLEMADHISEKPILGKFAELLRQCISWGLRPWFKKCW